MKEEEQKQAEIDRINEEQKAVRAEQEQQEMVRAERAEIDRREEQKEQDRRDADRKEQDDKYYREKADRERAEADRRKEQKRAEQERHRQEQKPNPIKEKRQVVEYFEHWQDVKGDKQTEANRNYIYAQYAHAIERAETPQELKEVLAKSGIEMKRSEQDPRVYQYSYQGTQAESMVYMTDKKVYSNRPQAIKETTKKIEPPKKQLQR